MVQGVVVQITTLAPSSSLAGAFTTGNFTQIVSEVCSLYSTSASASAVFSTTDQSTGFDPRKRPPFIRNLPISAAICASDAFFIVV
jgi:hypothetical protein